MRSFIYVCISLFLLMTSPIMAEINLPEGLTIEYEVMPNEIIQGNIPITNKSDQQTRVKISVADYSFTSDGNNFFDPPGTRARSNATWLNFDDDFYVDIPPKETVRVDYQIAVPKNEKLEGSYWSMLLIEPQKPLSKNPDEDNTLSINTIIRYGIQFVTNIKNSGEEAISVIENRMSKNEDETYYVVDIKNNGSLLIRPKMTIELYNESGDRVAISEGGQFRLFPDTSVRYSAPLTNLPKGTYKSLVLFDYGEDSLFGYEDRVIIE